jgi:hypothetical protein
MADEFAQLVKGYVEEGMTIIATDGLMPMAAKDATDSKWYPLTVDDTTKALSVNVNNSSIAVTGTFWQATQPVSGTVTVQQPTGSNLHVQVDAGTALIGSAKIQNNAGDTVTGISGTYDTLDVSISDGTDRLAINSDGSINVSLSGAQNNVYTRGAVTLVKDTPNTVVTHTPASVTEYFKQIIVSGAGLCHWTVKFGTTSSEAAIIDVWTTPSHPTEVIDIPDSLAVATTETILVSAENKEKAATTGSDFTGYATLIRAA